jgi:hypothetical protein
MKRTLFCLSFSLFVLCIGAFTGLVSAQDADSNEVVISLYQVVPGKHLDFLKWQARQEAVNKEAGVPGTKWYSHLNGASWDYIAIAAVPTPEQSKKAEEIAKQKGYATGFKAGLEFRSFISSHSDTFVSGPMTISDLLKSAE